MPMSKRNSGEDSGNPRVHSGSIKIVCVKQPWAWLIVAGHKDIENRSWATTHRGPLLISASAHRLSGLDLEDVVAYARARGVEIPIDQLHYGGVIGRASVTECVYRHNSRWFMGPVGWVLSDAAQLPFVPVRGRLTLFDAPAHVLEALKLPAAVPPRFDP